MPKKKKSPAVTKPLPDNVVHNPKRSLPPPPPPPTASKRFAAPPPPPPPVNRSTFVDTVKAEAKSLRIAHRKPIEGATHIEFRTEVGAVIVAPVKAWEDFSTMKGVMRFGKLIGNDMFRYAPGEDPAEQADHTYVPGVSPVGMKPGYKPPPPPPGAPNADGSPAPARAKSAGGKREGVCGFIDQTILEGGRTVAQILEIVLAKFPGRDPKATESTIRCRPSHIKKAHAGEANFVCPPFVK